MKMIALDSTVGGMGDIWMRLNALYSLAALHPAGEIQLRIPKSLVQVAQLVWPDRLQITNESIPGAIEITHLGIRHLACRLLRGHRFLTPFYQIHRADRKTTTLKQQLNDILIYITQAGGRFHVPTASSVNYYQGFHEFSAIKELSAIPYKVFLQQAANDFAVTRARMEALWPKEETPRWRTIVLPSGTAHQIMPPGWARANLPEATFVFFAQDPFKAEFVKRGFQIVEFDSVERLLEIAAQAQFAVVTDSFPSHPLQNYSSSTVVALSQQPPSRIVHPAFEGRVIHSKAPCSPCGNRARGFGKCAAGFEFCTTWSDNEYTQELLTTVA
jgi:hypothetical protein